MENGPEARATARLLHADQSSPRTRQSDRRHRPQTRRAVLVHAHPLTGLRPPATVADPQEAPPPGDHRRRPEIHPTVRRDLVDQRADAQRRARARPPSRDVIHANRPRPTSRPASEESGRERDTGARIGSSHSKRTKQRGRPQAPDVCSSLPHQLAPNREATPRPTLRQDQREQPLRKYRLETT